MCTTDAGLSIIEFNLIYKLSRGNLVQNTWVSKFWLKHKYVYKAHKGGHHRHFETVFENAKFRGFHLYTDDTKI